MDASYVVCLTYRVFSRSREGSQLNAVQDQILSKYDGIKISEGVNRFWPVDPGQISDLRERGILITELADDVCVIVQELKAEIPVGTYAEAVTIAESIITGYPKTFASIQIQTSYFTDVHAV